MKKSLFIVVAMMLTFSASAQKMKIQKGEVQFDGVSVAKIEKQKKSNVFTFSDLNGTPLFTVSEETKTPSGITLPDPILVFTGTNDNVQEISIQGSKARYILINDDYMAQRVLNCGTDLITPKGLDQDKIHEFFKTSNRSVSETFIAMVEQTKADIAKEDELANSVKLTINGNANGTGDILVNGEKIGNISIEKDATKNNVSTIYNNDYIYKISELNNIFIASMTAKAVTNPSFYDTETYDGKIFPVFSEKGFSFRLSTDDNAKRLVRKLYYEGYTLGDMKKFFKEKRRAAEDSLIAVSGNIYQKLGYVIDKKEKKIEGLITLEFMPKSYALGKTQSTMSELRKYGKQVFVKTENEEDSHIALDDRGKIVLVKNELVYNASDGVRVVVDSVQYLGVAGSLIGRETFFYRIVYEKDGNMVLYEHKFGTSMLKLANQKNPKELYYKTLLGNKNPEKIQKEFDDYVNCPALNCSDYKVDTVDGLIQLVNDYVEKCK